MTAFFTSNTFLGYMTAMKILCKQKRTTIQKKKKKYHIVQAVI